MSIFKKTITIFIAGIILLSICTGCTSTRTENGVSIEQKRSLNSLKFW
ncbi:MAG: hypothetical protein ACSHX8_09500 [Opitutaceae bacterium]